jgi:hypothetical protein
MICNASCLSGEQIREKKIGGAYGTDGGFDEEILSKETT